MTLFRRPFVTCAITALLSAPLAASAQTQAAHVHGQIRLDIVVDGPAIVIAMQSPLDNFVGFERAPRTEAEKKTVEDAIAQLRAGAELFKIDPAANCKLGPVTLRSAALGLGQEEQGAAEGHADLDASFAFNCTNTTAAKFIDVELFNAFKGLRQIEAQIAAPQGQFKRTLKRPAVRLAWGK